MSFTIPKNVYDIDNPPKDDHKETKNRIEKINELNKLIKVDKLPEEVKISTMTVTCKMEGIIFNILNIAKYIDLSQDGIIGVAHGLRINPETNRTIIKKKRIKSKKRVKKTFQNQMSMYISIKGKKKPINIKLFRNGSIQMTGCKTIENIFEVLDIVFEKLRCHKAILKYSTKKIIDKPFVNDLSKLTISNISNMKIQMINSNFSIAFKVDRIKLYQLFLDKNMNCLFDPMKHACVNIKYEHADNPISIFIFERGSIIITGVKNCEQIYDAYKYIYELLLRNYKHIVKNDSIKIESFYKTNKIKS